MYVVSYVDNNVVRTRQRLVLALLKNQNVVAARGTISTNVDGRTRIARYRCLSGSCSRSNYAIQPILHAYIIIVIHKFAHR